MKYQEVITKHVPYRIVLKINARKDYVLRKMKIKLASLLTIA